jgi:hypothetical protein
MMRFRHFLTALETVAFMENVENAYKLAIG